jgi:hypothetical protein
VPLLPNGCYVIRMRDRNSEVRQLEFTFEIFQGVIGDLESIILPGHDLNICRSRWLLTSVKRRRFASTRVTRGIRVFYKDRFLCRAISAELASETIPLRDLIRVRNQGRKELRSILLDHQKMVDTLLLLKKGPTTAEPDASTTPPARAAARVKRYRNE